MAYSQQAVKNAWSPRCTPPWTRVQLYGGAQVTVDSLIVEAVMALNTISKAYDYKCSGYDNAGYGCRKVAGTSKWSKHSYGIAIDREFTRNPYRYPLTTDRPAAMNRAIVNVRTNNGKQVWGWGGYWRKPDAMHDEIVCFPQDLAHGINWATVAGYEPLPAKPVDWAKVRRLAAATVLPNARKIPNMGPGHTGPGAYGADIWVAVMQQALNIVTGTKLKENGIYDAWTEGVVKNFQNFVTKVLKVPMPDPHGHFRDHTRFYLVASLQNIADGKA